MQCWLSDKYRMPKSIGGVSLAKLVAGADPGFLPGEGAKGLMTLYGIGMSDF